MRSRTPCRRALLFGVPLPGLDDRRYDVASKCAMAFAGTFFALFAELWQKRPFPVPAGAEIDPGLRAQLGRCSGSPSATWPPSRAFAARRRAPLLVALPVRGMTIRPRRG